MNFKIMNRNINRDNKKINENKRWVFKKINIMDKPLLG